jgi:hypothetical protein
LKSTEEIRFEVNYSKDFHKYKNMSSTKLLKICTKIFESKSPFKYVQHTPASIAPLTKYLQKMKVKDLGKAEIKFLDEARQVNFQTENYLPIYENDPGSFIIGIFFLPPNTRIPLHDHPDMCVTSKILEGNCRVRSYDWLQTTLYSSTGASRSYIHYTYADLVQDEWKKKNDVWSLFQNTGNVHEITSGEEGCALLDVIAPDYDGSSRVCTFYKEERSLSISEGNNDYDGSSLLIPSSDPY